MENGTNGIPETVRQALVASYAIDVVDVVAQLDRLAGLAASLCEASIGLVSIVETDRLRFIGRSGTELAEVPLESSFCAHAMLGSECMVVADAKKDRRFHGNPLVIAAPSVRFYAGQPLVSREGAPLGSLCVMDAKPRTGLTEGQLQALETLAEAAMALLERCRFEKSSDRLRARSDVGIADLQQHFQVLADAMPQLVWSTTPEGMADYFNRGWCEFTGQPAEDSYGTHWVSLLHPDDRTAAEQCWMKAVATGEDYEIEYRLLHRDGEHRWVLARGLPLRNGDGEITRWIGTCTDIHEQKAAAERLEVLSRELNHRIKNIFAVIGGLIALSMRSKPELAPLAGDLRDRVLALGRAHDFVRSSGDARHGHGRLAGLLQTLLAPYQDADGGRIVIRGADVAIDDRSATPLALFFHELATNAAKYGALSNERGHVEIGIGGAEEIELVWTEFGGPRVAPPGEPGFGSRLVEMSMKRQLGGTLDYDWREQGLCVTARIPAATLTR